MIEARLRHQYAHAPTPRSEDRAAARDSAERPREERQRRLCLIDAGSRLHNHCTTIAHPLHRFWPVWASVSQEICAICATEIRRRIYQGSREYVAVNMTLEHGDGVRRQAVCATETRRGHARQDSLPSVERCPRKGALAIRQPRQTRKTHTKVEGKGWTVTIDSGFGRCRDRFVIALVCNILRLDEECEIRYEP